MTDNTTLVPAPGPTSMQMRQDFAALVNLKSAIMRSGTDYGTIPGCGDRPSLFKPGAEKVLKRFMVHVVDIPVEDLSTTDCIRYRVRCIGQTPDGVVRGVGIGECSTDEEKYRWKKAYDQEYNDTVDDRRRVKHYKNYTAKQVRTNPADLANTVLKMAKKRAMVDLALTSTAASDFFTQDLEDMDPELRDAVAAERTARPKDPFAPPPIDTTAEPVPEDGPPPAKVQVWQVAQEMGLGGADVKDVLEEQGVPTDASQWTVKVVEQICEALRARAQPPPADTPYTIAVKDARGSGATDEEIQLALAYAGLDRVPVGDFTTEHGDTLLSVLERNKGA